MLNLENQLFSEKQKNAENIPQNVPLGNKNSGSISTLEKLNNNEVVTINYTVEEIDNIINKFPIGIDSKGKKLCAISLF